MHDWMGVIILKKKQDRQKFCMSNNFKNVGIVPVNFTGISEDLYTRSEYSVSYFFVFVNFSYLFHLMKLNYTILMLFYLVCILLEYVNFD